MLDKVRQTVQRYRLLTKGDKVIVGVSGGPDSLALLHSLLELKDEFDYTIHVAHLNHKLRPEADTEAEYVSNYARRLGLGITVVARDVLLYQIEHNLSLEEAARKVRYDFLQETADKVGATKIAVGHQADDQAETVLLNLLRGSGLTGLKAMLPVRGRIIRPLLFISRAEIEAYCREHNIAAVQDFSNSDLQYRRNKIRHLLLPLLAREFNPSIINTLSRTAFILQEEEEILLGLAQEAFSRSKKLQDEEKIVLDCQELLVLSPAIQRRVLRLAASNLNINVSFNQIEEAREIISDGGVINWPRKLQVRVEDKELIIQVKRKTEDDNIGFFYQLQVPGVTYITETGQKIRADFSLPPITFSEKEDEAWLDWHKLEKPLIVRNWRPGDCFRPLGMGGKKKVQDFFTDIYLPSDKRSKVPLVLSGKRIAWIAGFRLADDFKITSETRLALHLKLES